MIFTDESIGSFQGVHLDFPAQPPIDHIARLSMFQFHGGVRERARQLTPRRYITPAKGNIKNRAMATSVAPDVDAAPESRTFSEQFSQNESRLKFYDVLWALCPKPLRQLGRKQIPTFKQARSARLGWSKYTCLNFRFGKVSARSRGFVTITGEGTTSFAPIITDISKTS